MIYLSKKFNLKERDFIQGFRNYMRTGERSKAMQKLSTILKTISILSSECEREFSQMNLIGTRTRSRILIENLSPKLFIRIVGPPLLLFKPNKYGCPVIGGVF